MRTDRTVDVRVVAAGFGAALHGLQVPPQSTPVSLPFRTPSEQVAA